MLQFLKLPPGDGFKESSFPRNASFPLHPMTPVYSLVSNTSSLFTYSEGSRAEQEFITDHLSDKLYSLLILYCFNVFSLL